MTEQQDNFDQKYEKYKSMVYNICYTYSKNQFDADDLFQESFFEFFKLHKKFKESEQEKYYLIRLTINNCKDFYRKKRNRRIVLENSIVDKQAVETTEDINVFELIYKLSPKLKEVTILKYANQLNNKEIANILKISEENVRKRLERAYEKLRKEWGDKDERT